MTFNDNTNPIHTPHLHGFVDDNKMLTYLDSLPQISPMNINNMILFPPSTRNMFNFDISSYDNYIKNVTHPSFSNNTPKHCFANNLISPSNKEINLQNKILVNEVKQKNDDHSGTKEDKSNEDTNANNLNNKRHPQIDISLINQSEPGTLLESIGTLRNNTTNFFNLSPVSAFVPKMTNDQ